MVEFRTAEGEALAISIPRGEAAVIRPSKSACRIAKASERMANSESGPVVDTQAHIPVLAQSGNTTLCEQTLKDIRGESKHNEAAYNR